MVYVPNGSEKLLLQDIIDNILQGATLHAFVANHTPVAADTAATYNAIEAAFGGYAAITLNLWSAAFTNVSDVAQTIEAVRTWTTTGAGLPTTVFGIYVLDSGGQLVYAELNPAGGVTLTAAAQIFSYIPIFTLRTQP